MDAPRRRTLTYLIFEKSLTCDISFEAFLPDWLWKKFILTICNTYVHLLTHGSFASLIHFK